MDQDDPEKRIADLERQVAAPHTARESLENRERAREDYKRARREALKRVEDEAGVSPAQRRAQMGRTKRVVGRTLLMLPVLGIAVFIAGLVFRHTTSWIWIVALAMVFLGFVPIVAYMVNYHRKIEKVRWQEGTVTFRRVEPGFHSKGLVLIGGDSHQIYDCEVELNPTGRILWVHAANVLGRRATAKKGIRTGATMRCLIDRTHEVAFRAFPWAEPDAPLPSGKKLLFLVGISGDPLR